MIEGQPFGIIDFRDPHISPSLFHGVLYFGLNITEPYMHDRVSRQFGLVQNVPATLIYPIKVVRVRSTLSYIADYHTGVWEWDTQNFHSVGLLDMGDNAMDGYDYSPAYMDWYMWRTHMFIQRPKVDEYVGVMNRVREYVTPYADVEYNQHEQVVEAVRRSLEEMRSFHYQQ